MAQRYADPVARERMAGDCCPECGEAASAHLNDPRFWLPRNCGLLPVGVRDRIAQYQADSNLPVPGTEDTPEG